jgi:hypothetical protein
MCSRQMAAWLSLGFLRAPPPGTIRECRSFASLMSAPTAVSLSRCGIRFSMRICNQRPFALGNALNHGSLLRVLAGNLSRPLWRARSGCRALRTPPHLAHRMVRDANRTSSFGYMVTVRATGIRPAPQNAALLRRFRLSDTVVLR